MGVADVLILKPGDAIPGKNMNIPKDFLSLITNRKNDWNDTTQYKTCGKGGFLTVMPQFKPQNSYAMLSLTMKDLYPQPSWGFCFGWASFTEGVGAFSFCRFDPKWDGIEDPDSEKNLLMRACHIMCHEIGH